MTTWKAYSAGNTSVQLEDISSKYIVEALGEILKQFFSYEFNQRPQRTALIKSTLANLGNKKLKGKPPYSTYVNGVTNLLGQEDGVKNNHSEWLYDLHWYTDTNEPYLPQCSHLVVECEWNPKRKGERKVSYNGIKYDFQKLLVANSDLRLMIFIIKNDTDILELDRYFDKAIDNYANLNLGSKFLFIAFDQRINGFHYVAKQKQ